MIYTILSIAIAYLAVGAAVSALFAGVLNHLEEVEQFTNRERLAVMLVWPLAVATFIHGFISERRSGRK